MSALSRPDIPPGARRDLIDALHDLHHQAGWPSLRTLAREAGCSHTTVSTVFSSPKLPPWGTLELIVEAMHGDTDEFHHLWIAASQPPDSHTTPPTPTARIAGRKSELTAVRHHLESGTGLLLITGEAGIGKTKLIQTAIDTTDVFVATGHCLPLSAEVPLLPIAEVLRGVLEESDGRWLEAALADCPPYLVDSLSRLLPELARDGKPSGGADAPQLLFGAIAGVLTALARIRPLAIAIDDLHWSDTATLDLLEHLFVRDRSVTMLGTWRLDDISTAEAHESWFARVRRSRATSVVDLRPMTLEETVEQVRLLTGTEPDPARVARVYERSAGQPLFTEQLTLQSDERELPRLLSDLLDHRLGPLEGEAWRVARALGIADRGLEVDVLGAATGLTEEDLTTALHELGDRRLLGSATSAREVRLAHPLLAEAVRRRVMPGEKAAEHRRLAAALAAGPTPAAAEVAGHWQAAGDNDQELAWRVQAAHDAARRLGPRQESDQWMRALELWPACDTSIGTPGMSRTSATFRAIDTLWASGQPERADALVASLLPQLEGLASPDAAEVLYDAAMCEANLRSKEAGLHFIVRSVALLESLGPSPAQVSTLRMQAMILKDLGRLSEASTVCDRALELNRIVGDVEQERRLMAERAWHLFEAGRRRDALEMVATATRIEVPTPDPFGDVTVSKHHTDMLLEAGAPGDEVIAAAQPGLAIADTWGIDSDNVSWLIYDIAVARSRLGDIGGAAAVIDPLTDGEPVTQHHPADLARAELDLRRGRFDDVHTRADRVRGTRSFSLDVRNRWCELRAELALWEGHPDRSLDLTLTLLDELVTKDEVVYGARYFVLAARSAADVAEAEHLDVEEARRRTARLEGLRASADRDPLAFDPGHAATWTAELSRLEGRDVVEPWTRAAAEWDKLDRRHDSACCRWRGAQAAMRGGQGTVAARLLRRAARDAREHVPLAAAIAATTAYAQGS